jgi:hypothetical protein
MLLISLITAVQVILIIKIWMMTGDVRKIRQKLNEPQAENRKITEAQLKALEGKTEEAIFANAVDRMIPFTLNCYNNGLSWIEAGVTYEKVKQLLRPKINEASEEMAEAFDILIKKAFDEGKLI